jgi:outer membrane protein assembly factor BamA
MSYYNPNIIGNEHFFIRSSFSFSDVTNRSPNAEKLYGSNFSQKIIGTRLLFGKRFGLFNRLYVSSGFNYIETPFYIPGINISKNRIDNLVDLGIGFEHDTRDLIQFPKNGIFSSFIYTLKGLGLDDISYGVALINFKEYRKLFDELVGKWRVATRFTFGDDVPYYDYSILGLGERIRGHYSEKFEGRDYYFGSFELYYPIVEELHIDLTFIPIIPNELLSYRLGFYVQLFAETGVVKNKNEPLMIKNFNSGYGIGLTFLVLPYQIFRLEVAFDEKMNTELILDLGISF